MMSLRVTLYFMCNQYVLNETVVHENTKHQLKGAKATTSTHYSNFDGEIARSKIRIDSSSTILVRFGPVRLPSFVKREEMARCKKIFIV